MKLIFRGKLCMLVVKNVEKGGIYMDIKEQRNKLLDLLKCWTGGYGNAFSVSKSFLYRDSQKLIREIYEQIASEDVEVVEKDKK